MLHTPSYTALNRCAQEGERWSGGYTNQPNPLSSRRLPLTWHVVCGTTIEAFSAHSAKVKQPKILSALVLETPGAT